MKILKKFFKHKTDMKDHDFSLNSGERQIGTKLIDIREDHRQRYQKVIDIINSVLKNNDKPKALDIFCGIGYGSYMIASAIPNIKIDAIDGSVEAILKAKEFYKSKKIKFISKIYPFNLKENYYDFIISLESIEHIQDDMGFLDKLTRALKPNGYLFLSTPNDNKYNLKINRIKYHYRHYIPNEIENILKKKFNLDIIGLYGHDTYITDENGKTCAKLVKDFSLKKFYEGQNVLFICKKSGIHIERKFLGFTYYEYNQFKKNEDYKIFGELISIRKKNNISCIYILGKKVYKKIHLASVYDELNKKISNLDRKLYNLQVLSKVPSIHRYFSNYRNSFNGRDVVLMGSGPSINKFTNIENAIYVGVNGVVRICDKLDFIFVQDQFMLDKNLNSEIDQYTPMGCRGGGGCQKFFGMLPQKRLEEMCLNSFSIRRRYDNLRIAQERLYKKNAHIYFLEDIKFNRFATNLECEAFGDFAGTIFSALQFIMYCNPKRLFLVGCDCTSGVAYECEFNFNHKHQIDNWRKFKIFKDEMYPSIEIYSINPVELRYMFNDIYTDNEGKYVDSQGKLFKF